MSEKLEVRIENGKIYSFLRDKMLVATPEEKVRQEFVCTLVNDFGYSLDQMEEEKPLFEGYRGNGQARADLVIYEKSSDIKEKKNPIIVIECKAENVKIHPADYYQGQSYAFICQAKFFVTTNLRETKYFQVNLGKTPKKLGDEIVTIPKAEDVNNEKKVKEILSQTKAFSREEFTNLLFKCHNIIRNNDKLSPEAAFDEISKILFIKINYERDEKGKKIFTLKEYEKREKMHESDIRPQLKGTNRDLPYMQFMFLKTKDKFQNDHLFDVNEIIKIRETSFRAILELLEKYNLSDTSDDVKGIAFEQFLGRTFRGELGQFFTPRTVVDFITETLDPKEGELICDPCCGSGGFLIKAFDYIRSKIENDIQKQKEKIKVAIESQYTEDMTEKRSIELNEKIDLAYATLNKELEHVYDKNSGIETKSRLDRLSYDSIYGTDANPRMARTSKMNMIMHGDGHGGVHHHDGLININGIFENHFDIILTNPPFGASVSKTQEISWDDIDNNESRIKEYKEKYKNEGYFEQLQELQRRVNLEVIGNNIPKEKLLLSLYETGKMSTLTEVLFIERCLRLLKPGGRMGIVLPEGVLNNSNLQKVREYFESQAKLILICSIPQDVFIKAGATVKPSLIFMKKFTDEEKKQYDEILSNAQKEVKAKYQDKLDNLDMKLKSKTILKKDNNSKKKFIKENIENEVKALVKERFDYEIPIAKVEKAGITTTGMACENELLDVLAEFKKYNAENYLWEEKDLSYDYSLAENDSIYKIINENGKQYGVKLWE